MHYVYSDELSHHGVLGMKWGIRRYQPYPKGQKVKGGKEIGEAAKVKQYTDYKIKKKSSSTAKKISKLQTKSKTLEAQNLKLEGIRAKKSKKATKTMDKVTKKIHKNNEDVLNYGGSIEITKRQAKKYRKATSLNSAVGKLDMKIYKNDKRIAKIPRKIEKLKVKNDKYAQDLIETGKKYLEELKKRGD